MSERKKPKALQLYLDYHQQFDNLSDEEAGQLIKALFEYAVQDISPTFENRVIATLFQIYSAQINRDFEKYADTCKKRSMAGKLGGAPKYNHNASKTSKTSKSEQKEEENKEEHKKENEYDDKEKEKNRLRSLRDSYPFMSPEWKRYNRELNSILFPNPDNRQRP